MDVNDKKEDVIMDLVEIAKIYTDFPEKFGIPRQSGLVPGLIGRIIFHPEYRTPDAIRGIEGYSYLWLMWGFSAAKKEGWAATVAPPRLGGRTRMGVFATRSPFRPNKIGLSSVKLESVEIDDKLGPVLTVSGIDMLNETPIYDIKPYLPHVDAHPEATGGFATTVKENNLKVTFPEELLKNIRKKDRENIIHLLEQDPRTAYIHDDERLWGFSYSIYNIRFKVKDKQLTVYEITLQH